jgi:hypothetical protein
MLDELEWKLAVVKNGIAPFVEPDPFREQLGAQSVGETIDRVHAKSHARSNPYRKSKGLSLHAKYSTPLLATTKPGMSRR